MPFNELLSRQHKIRSQDLINTFPSIGWVGECVQTAFLPTPGCRCRCQWRCSRAEWESNCLCMLSNGVEIKCCDESAQSLTYDTTAADWEIPHGVEWKECKRGEPEGERGRRLEQSLMGLSSFTTIYFFLVASSPDRRMNVESAYKIIAIIISG